MPTSLTRYLFGRLNIVPPLQGDKEAFLLSVMQSPATVKRRRANWSLFEVRSDTIDGALFIHGFLVKYRPDGKDEVVREKEHVLTTTKVPNLVESKSRFFLHLPSLIIAFQATRGEISGRTFAQRFVDVLRAAQGGFFFLPEIQIIQEEFAVFEAIQRFDSVSKVSIYLHPSNPDITDDWKDFNRHLKDVGATSYREEYSAPPADSGGLKVGDDPQIRAKIKMAQDGYGKAAVTGTVRGRTRTITTRDSPVAARAPRDPEAEPAQVASALRSALSGILRRFNRKP